jgi:hypothetical protein
MDQTMKKGNHTVAVKKLDFLVECFLFNRVDSDFDLKPSCLNRGVVFYSVFIGLLELVVTRVSCAIELRLISTSLLSFWIYSADKNKINTHMCN